MTIPVLRVEGKRAYPPRVSEFTRQFWEALAEGRFTTTQCGNCGKRTFPPKPICPHCWSKTVSWTELSGRGRLYSWTRVHAAPAVFASQAPYEVGIVDLADGLRIACALRPVAGAPFVPDMPVELVVLAYDDGALFAARPT